jgi:hypothetical protein
MPPSSPPFPRLGTGRLGELLAVVAIVVAVLCALGPTAHADGASLRAEPAHPTNREAVTISGRFSGADAGRTVLLLCAAVLAVLVIWGQIYEHAPAVVARPFSVKTHWLNDAVHTWSLQWPVSVLWTILEFFATPAGLLSFGALAVVSVLLPAPRGLPGTSALTPAHGAAANASALIVGSAALAVISIVAFAVLVLAAVALMAYVMFYVLVAFTTAAMLAYLFKR